MKTVTIYTDGTCSGNPGSGGWGVVLLYGENRKEISGGAPNTTNNIMELQAVVRALNALKEPCNVELYLDSQYVQQGIEKWISNWTKHNWRKANGDTILNADLWKQLMALSGEHHITYHWVHGHVGSKENARCDSLAVAESKRFSAI